MISLPRVKPVKHRRSRHLGGSSGNTRTISISKEMDNQIKARAEFLGLCVSGFLRELVAVDEKHHILMKRPIVISKRRIRHYVN